MTSPAVGPGVNPATELRASGSSVSDPTGVAGAGADIGLADVTVSSGGASGQLALTGVDPHLDRPGS